MPPSPSRRPYEALEQREVKYAIRLPANDNPGNLWRRLVLPARIGNRSLTSLQQRLVKTGGV